MDPKLEERPERPELIEAVHATSGGVELALAACLGLALGYFLDGVFGIRPVLTIVFFLWFAIALGFVFYSRYRRAMEIHEAQLPSRSPITAQAGDTNPETEPDTPSDTESETALETEPAAREPEIPSVGDLYLANADSSEFVRRANETFLNSAASLSDAGEGRRS